jgi:hypothetical protein
MLSSFGLNVDECYITAWRESKYSLIHFSRDMRVRRSTIDKAMQRMKDMHGIVGVEIFGFDHVACNWRAKCEQLDQHPGFKLMVKNLNSKKDIHIWIEKGEVRSYRKGVLWKYLEGIDPEQMTRCQLVKEVKKMNAGVQQIASVQAGIELSGTLSEEKPRISSIRAVLLDYRRDKPHRNVMRRIIKLEKRLNKTSSPDGSGEIYAALNPLMHHLHKLGFTFKDAQTRVNALQTAGVLEPFELVRCVRVPDAR